MTLRKHYRRPKRVPKRIDYPMPSKDEKKADKKPNDKPVSKTGIYAAYYKGLSKNCSVEVDGRTHKFQRLIPKDVSKQLADDLEMNRNFSIVKNSRAKKQGILEH